MNTENTAPAGLSDSEAEAALIEKMGGGADAPEDEGVHTTSEEDEEGGDDGEAGHEAEEGNEEGHEEDDASPEDDAPAAQALGDDHVVQIEIDGAPKDFTLGSLKDLAHRSDAIERRGREVDLVGGQAIAALQSAIGAAHEDMAPYLNVDWNALALQMHPEELAWHRDAANKAAQRYEALVGAAKGFEQAATARKQAINADDAKAAVTELRRDIPEWSDQHYNDILSFGAAQGLDAAELATVTNPKVIKLIRMAMLYDKAKTVGTKKVKASADQPLRSQATPSTNSAIKAKKAMSSLAKTGSDSDAIAVLMGRMG